MEAEFWLTVVVIFIKQVNAAFLIMWLCDRIAKKRRPKSGKTSGKH